jgi:hypothetical protein
VNNWLVLIIGGLIMFVAMNYYRLSKISAETKEINDLTKAINANEQKASDKQKQADADYKEYEDALKKFDPDFHNHHDDGESH